MSTKLFDANDLLDGKCSHHEYYAQFVNAGVKNHVLHNIGLERLLASTDEHLNDIALTYWDRMPINRLIDVATFKQCHNVTYREEDRKLFNWSISQGVCIAKAAARIIIDDLKKPYGLPKI